MWKYALLLVFGTFISSISQVMLKIAARRQYDSVLKEYLNPMVMISYLIFFLSTLLSLIAFRGIPLSMGPVLEGSAYVFVTIFGVTIFKEKLNAGKFAALVLILTGITVYSVFG